MKKDCKFEMNPAFVLGVILLWVGVMLSNVFDVQGVLLTVTRFVNGVGAGCALVGLLYGSPKTRPLFQPIHNFKMRLLGRG